jgi:DNA repair protein RadA/Sms
MAKKKAVFVCQNCGHSSPRWAGKCPSCGEWNSLVEELQVIEHPRAGRALSSEARAARPTPIHALPKSPEKRMLTHVGEFDRMLGNGIVPGSVCLIGGEPGIGKSTLLLQVAHQLCLQNEQVVLYVTGEESAEQLRLRGDRLGTLHERLYVLPETNTDLIIEHISTLRPNAVIVDSIQTIYLPELESAPGSVSQIRESAARLLYLAKAERMALFFIGHVTKSGVVAGPRVLEHMVDTVLYFEGARHHSYRILRAVKNRFGSTNEIGIFEMTTSGLKEVENPSEIFLQERPEETPGSVVSSAMEGTRPLLVEIQALTSFNGGFGIARRSTSGVDHRRVALLIAVLEKRVGLRLVDQDVFVNIAGGIRVDEPAVDLAIALATVSSFRNRAVDPRLVAIGEVGLAGEIRSVSHLDRRVSEAARLGFTKCMMARSAATKRLRLANVEFLLARSLSEALDLLGFSV